MSKVRQTATFVEPCEYVVLLGTGRFVGPQWNNTTTDLTKALRFFTVQEAHSWAHRNGHKDYLIQNAVPL